MKLSLHVLCTALHVTVGCIISGPANETITRPAGGAVLLPCSCTDLQTKPEEFQWSYVNDKWYFDVIGNWAEAEKNRYSGRVQIFNASAPGNASLLLSDLTEEDQGEYTCIIFTKQSTSERIITLIVKEHPKTTTLPSMPFFIRLALSVLLVMVGATAVICSSCRRKLT
ncbi:V-set and immunoglobulin domain-containing protein 1-like [Sardina pilchardus]|uniref:V-set and immunoglobulin domain-containing protein 1-like n=1 Tax=Sardina pilchardus TaxID=27697 RepID=UPI002E0E268A